MTQQNDIPQIEETEPEWYFAFPQSTRMFMQAIAAPLGMSDPADFAEMDDFLAEVAARVEHVTGLLQGAAEGLKELRAGYDLRED